VNGCVTLPGHLYQAANIASEAEMLAMTPEQLKAASIPIAARKYLSEVRAFESHVGVQGLLIEPFFVCGQDQVCGHTLALLQPACARTGLLARQVACAIQKPECLGFRV
jgi:hypothetical protein